MSDISTGGRRDRLIRDAATVFIKDNLDALGWDDLGSKFQPIHWRDEAVTDQDDEIPLNTITVVLEDVPAKTEGELGSTYGEQRYPCYVDFYGENEDIARHITGDIRDILRGEYPSIGRTAPVLPVYDTTQDPVPVDPVFLLEIDRVEVDRAQRNQPKPFERFWFTVGFELVDER